MKNHKFSAKSRSESFRFAFIGLSALLKYEKNARVHLLAAIIAVTAGIILRIDIFEWCLLVIVIGIVFLTELLNTSIESLGDSVNNQQNERIKKAKDYAAAAVLVSAVLSIIVGGLIFVPKLISLL